MTWVLTRHLARAQVQDVHMLTHQDTGKLRGCFVAFATPEEVGLAVARDGSVSYQELRGRLHIQSVHVA